MFITIELKKSEDKVVELKAKEVIDEILKFSPNAKITEERHTHKIILEGYGFIVAQSIHEHLVYLINRETCEIKARIPLWVIESVM